MPGDVMRLDLRLRLRSTAAYTVGFAAYALLVVALYPNFEDGTSLNDLTAATRPSARCSARRVR